MDAEVDLACKARSQHALLARVDDGALADLLHRPALVEEEVYPEDGQDKEAPQVEVREKRDNGRAEPVVALRHMSRKSCSCPVVITAYLYHVGNPDEQQPRGQSRVHREEFCVLGK